MLDWVSFLIFLFVASITPGPNNILALTQATWVGFRNTFPFNIGVFLGMFGGAVLVTLATFFMRDLVPIIVEPLVYIGAAYILYLAYKTFTASANIKDSERVTRDGSPIGMGVGALLQFINPKAYIFFLLCLEGYIMPYYQDNIPMLLFFCVVMAFFGFICTIMWALFGAVFRTLFTKHARITNTVMALLLVYCAISFFM